MEARGRQTGRRGQRRGRQVGAEVNLDAEQCGEYVVQPTVLGLGTGQGAASTSRVRLARSPLICLVIPAAINVEGTQR